VNTSEEYEVLNRKRASGSNAEVELQAYNEELFILQHAQRLEKICGIERAIKVLESVARNISGKAHPSPADLCQVPLVR
jgi:hypothetical protein